MRKIPLSQGLFADVDDDIYNYLMQWKWSAAKTKDGRTYAIRHSGIPPFRTTIRMHRVIMSISGNAFVDHKDGNGLNNLRENLRICTNAENARNSRKRIDNKSGYKGVTWSSRHKKWKAEIRVNYKSVFLGYFSDPKEAAMEYDNAAKEYHGKYARTNF